MESQPVVQVQLLVVLVDDDRRPFDHVAACFVPAFRRRTSCRLSSGAPLNRGVGFAPYRNLPFQVRSPPAPPAPPSACKSRSANDLPVALLDLAHGVHQVPVLLGDDEELHSGPLLAYLHQRLSCSSRCRRASALLPKVSLLTRSIVPGTALPWSRSWCADSLPAAPDTAHRRSPPGSRTTRCSSTYCRTQSPHPKTLILPIPLPIMHH